MAVEHMKQEEEARANMKLALKEQTKLEADEIEAKRIRYVHVFVCLNEKKSPLSSLFVWLLCNAALKVDKSMIINEFFIFLNQSLSLVGSVKLSKKL